MSFYYILYIIPSYYRHASCTEQAPGSPSPHAIVQSRNVWSIQKVILIMPLYF